MHMAAVEAVPAVIIVRVMAAVAVAAATREPALAAVVQEQEADILLI